MMLDLLDGKFQMLKSHHKISQDAVGTANVILKISTGGYARRVLIMEANLLCDNGSAILHRLTWYDKNDVAIAYLISNSVDNATLRIVKITGTDNASDGNVAGTLVEPFLLQGGDYLQAEFTGVSQTKVAEVKIRYLVSGSGLSFTHITPTDQTLTTVYVNEVV